MCKSKSKYKFFLFKVKEKTNDLQLMLTHKRTCSAWYVMMPEAQFMPSFPCVTKQFLCVCVYELCRRLFDLSFKPNEQISIIGHRIKRCRCSESWYTYSHRLRRRVMSFFWCYVICLRRFSTGFQQSIKWEKGSCTSCAVLPIDFANHLNLLLKSCL